MNFHAIGPCCLIVMLCGCGTGSNSAPQKREGTKKGEPAAQAKPAGPPMPVTAETLAKDFRTDKAAAELKYGGKLLEVTGKVHDVYGKEISGQPTVILWGYREKTEVPMLVQCYFVQAQQNRAAETKKDEQVKVRGVCTPSTGLGSGTFVPLKESEFAP
jgi:hypothetical protein